MLNTSTQNAAMWLYNLGWVLVIHALRLNRRLREGYAQRAFQRHLPPAADIWLQAASVGESYLAWELLKNLQPARPVHILATTNTSQGMEILQRAIDDVIPNNKGLSARAAYFPFDKPTIMKKAVGHIRPKLMILLESVMWPAHLSALKRNGIKTLVINGRMTARSLKRYLWWPSVWHGLRPEKILAISDSDADRFARLFGSERVRVMPNIKFDWLDPDVSLFDHKNPLRSIIFPETKLLVFGSVRQQEESQVEKIIIEILGLHPQLVIGLFPRHVERVKTWISILNQHQLPWKLRSQTETAVPGGSVIVWDTFGELANAYKLSGAAFVGGTLRPLGGQNFLEPLTHGVRPVIGPFWENFAWVGSEIVQQGLVRVAAHWKEVVKFLDEELTEPDTREEVLDAALRYMQGRQGGTARACRLITKFLN